MGVRVDSSPMMHLRASKRAMSRPYCRPHGSGPVGRWRSFRLGRQRRHSEQRAVKTGENSDGRIEITNGINPGDKVVVRGAENLTETPLRCGSWSKGL